MAAEKVGEIYYEVTLDTSKALDQQKELARQLGEMPSTLTQSAQAAKSYATATEVAAKAATEAAQAMQSEAKAALEAAKSAQEKAQAAIADAQATQAQAQATKQSSAEQRSAASSTAEATKATQQATKATRDHAAAADGAAKSSGELRQATRQLPAQFTDIVTSIQAGQDPLTVLIQQGGQLKDQFGGVGAATRAMGGYILGLINPLTVAAAAVATFVYGLVAGQKEAQNLNAALIMTGQQSGVTTDQLSTMAASMDDMAGVTQSKATEALLTFINAGIRGEESLGKFTAAAIQLEKAGGASVEETAKKFKELEREPFKAAVKLDEAINFLDQSTKQHIKTLEEQGRMTDAARVAQEAYYQAIVTRTPKITEDIGMIERAWRGVVGAVKDLGESILDIGRVETNTAKLDELQKKLASFEQKYPNAPADSVMGRAKERVRLEIQGIEQQMKAGADLEVQRATEASKKRARDKADADAARYLTDQQKLQLQITKELGTLREAGASPSELKAREAAIRADFAKRQPRPKKAREPFDSQKYTASLSAKAAGDEWQRVYIIEQEALRQNDEHLRKKEISAAAHEENKTKILAAGNQSRQELMAKETRSFFEELDKQEKEKKQREQAAIQYGAALTKAINPVDALRQEYEAKLQLVQQYEQMMAMAGVDATAQAEATKAQIRNEYELQRTALAEQTFRSQSDANAFLIDSLNSLSQTATTSIMGLLQGTMSAQDAMKALAGTVLNEAVGALVQIGLQQIKNALLADTLAAADKARAAANGAVYAASVGAQVAGMSALAAQNAFAATAAIPIVGPGLAPAAAALAAATAGALGAPAVATAPLAGARQYGGPVSADSLYRVNERGAPEMYTASNGTQYMLPTANGNVTAANKIEGGGSVQWNIVVNNTAMGTQASASVDQQSRTVQIAVTEVAQQISSNSGPVWSAMRGSTNIRSAL